ncbi:hypothetical protein [Vibrio sp. OPT18]|nr:hypothetical protein [Vibrio sp. OPT18]MBE8574168.1 hypothetical protein [Vibrio sp. OPT18]
MKNKSSTFQEFSLTRPTDVNVSSISIYQLQKVPDATLALQKLKNKN